MGGAEETQNKDEVWLELNIFGNIEWKVSKYPQKFILNDVILLFFSVSFL